MLIDHLHVDDARFHVVADGDTLSLGDKTSPSSRPGYGPRR
jgi:hypothetical protein